MTFLGYTVSDHQIVLAMDTLATKPDGSHFMFFEKSFFFERARVLMTMKGSANIALALANELDEEKDNFPDPTSLINYVRSEAPDILNSLIEKMPDVEGTLTRVCFFYFEDLKPKVFKAYYEKTANFVFTENELLDAEMFTSNNIEWDTIAVQNSLEELNESLSDTNLKYGVHSVESTLMLMASLARFNDPPETHVGGYLILYKISANSFTKEILHDFDPHIDKEIFTLKKANLLANGSPNYTWFPQVVSPICGITKRFDL